MSNLPYAKFRLFSSNLYNQLNSIHFILNEKKTNEELGWGKYLTP